MASVWSALRSICGEVIIDRGKRRFATWLRPVDVHLRDCARPTQGLRASGESSFSPATSITAFACFSAHLSVTKTWLLQGAHFNEDRSICTLLSRRETWRSFAATSAGSEAERGSRVHAPSFLRSVAVVECFAAIQLRVTDFTSPIDVLRDSAIARIVATDSSLGSLCNSHLMYCFRGLFRCCGTTSRHRILSVGTFGTSERLLSFL